MGVAAIFSSLFRFRKTSLSLLVFLTYLIVIILQDIALNISLTPPKHEPEILKHAWEHLQIISSSKHPFTSPHNDLLHDYLESQIEEMTSNLSFAKISSDKATNHTILINQHDVFDKNNDANRVIYYESSNLLVKILGSDSSLPGVLLSAHFDSVPTSFGTTDDGMGIASMLGTLEHIAKVGKQPTRTLIFNFNNNEEFGLLGAEAFVEHEWFKDVGFFINLEGTGAGGQPVLFRGTDKGVLDWYRSVSKPFANSIFQEGFNSGFISSQTDYFVYERSGLRGIDIAFYQPRSFYHTFKDSIKYTSKGSLWMMMNNVIEILDDFLYSFDNLEEDLNYSIYFDILNKWYFNFGINTVFIFNVLLLVALPVIEIILLIIILQRKTWFVGTRGWGRFPVAMVLSYWASLFTLKRIGKWNPLLLSVDYYYPLFTIFSIVLLITYAVLTTAAHIKPVDDQKLIILLEISFVAWVSVAWITFQMNTNSNICGYSLTIFYILSFLASTIGLLKLVFRKSPCLRKSSRITYGATERGESNNNSNNDSHVHDIPAEGVEELEEHNCTPTSEENEDTPLMAESIVRIEHDSDDSLLHKLKHNAINSSQYDWLVQFLTLVPISIFFIYTEGKLVVDALHETVQENTRYDKAVWNSVGLFGALLAIVLAPFTHKLNFISIQLVGVLLIYSLVGCYYSAPYNESSPIKLRYTKSFDINTNSSMSNVYGRQGYVPDIISEVPYIGYEDISCVNFTSSGTETCSYEGQRPWLLSGDLKDNSFQSYMNITVLSNTNVKMSTEDVISARDQFTPLESVLQIDIDASRQCYLTFNTSNPKVSTPVKTVTIYKDGNLPEEESVYSIPSGFSKDGKGNWLFKQMKGIEFLSLHRLAWSSSDSEEGKNTFIVKLQWLPFSYDNDIEIINSMGVNVECFWSDYDEVVTVEGEQRTRVQDYLDLMMFTDVGVAWTNQRPGVVQGLGYIEV